jgi:hypothetical protein
LRSSKTKQQLDQKHVWGPVTGLDMDVHRVRVALPQDGIDCMLLDGLIEHEAIDPFVKQAVASGGTFRLVRLPCSIAGSPELFVTRARVTATIREASDTRPEIYSIFPTRLEIEDESETEFSIGPKLSIGQAVELSGFDFVRRVKTTLPRSLITGLWSPNTAEWILKPSSLKEGLIGTWSFLFVLRWSTQPQPLAVSVSVIVEATPRQESLFPRLFLRSKKLRNEYRRWDPKTCRDVL